MISDQDFDTIAQRVHVLVGAVAIFIPFLFGGKPTIIPAAMITICASAVKEFYWDYKYETAEFRGSSLEDFCYYLVGIATAIGIISTANYF